MTDLDKLQPKEDKNAQKKLDYLEYFKQLPSQKLAAAKIAKDEDTIIRWRKEDGDFADQIEQAKAEWALKNVKSVRSKEWLLERLMRDTFQPPQQKTDITSGGKPIPILGRSNVIPENTSNNKNLELEETN